MTPGHTLTVHFHEGDCQFITMKCHLTGPERPCAIITCPVEHEDVSHACVEAHGATAIDACWAEDWAEIDRECIDTQALRPVTFPVEIDYDTGLVLRPAAAVEPTALQEAVRRLLVDPPYHDCRGPACKLCHLDSVLADSWDADA